MLRAGSAGEGVKNRRNAPERKVRPLVMNNLRQRLVAILDFFYAFGRSAFWAGDLLEPAREGEKRLFSIEYNKHCAKGIARGRWTA